MVERQAHQVVLTQATADAANARARGEVELALQQKEAAAALEQCQEDAVAKLADAEAHSQALAQQLQDAVRDADSFRGEVELSKAAAEAAAAEHQASRAVAKPKLLGCFMLCLAMEAAALMQALMQLQEYVC